MISDPSVLSSGAHAFGLYGEPETALSALKAALADVLKFPATANPDYREWVVDSLTIEHARDIGAEQSMLPLVHDRRVIAVAFSGAHEEAQNALLKTLEEPSPRALFVVIAPSEDHLLATVRSRLTFLGSARTDDATGFLSALPAERMKMIALVKEDGASLLLERVIKEAERYAAADPAARVEVADAAAYARRYAGTRGSSTNMLLEFLAGALPRISS